ncbi:MAG: response regulator transcription factor [Eubacterium sp.]|nr:response regulator transcription factor [Eubacterium sp.]
MQTVYIVEDDLNIQEIEMYALRTGGFEARGFGEAESFYEAVREKKPDLVLLDIMLPDEDGYSVLNKIRMSPLTRDLPVIMVTAKASEIETVKGLDAGADDYIAKPFGIMELISRVRALLRRAGKDPVREQLILDGLVLDPGKRMCYAGDRQIDLTYKEYELLYCLMRNAGMVMKRDVLMEKIWGIDYEGGSRTLDAHIKSLRKKLGEEGSHIRTVRNVGYLAR